MENGTNHIVTSTLIGVHVTLAVAAGLFPVFVSVSDGVDDISVAILGLSQMSLLSLWIGFGNTHLLVRLGAVAGAGVCLATLILCADAGGWPMFSLNGWFILAIVFAPVPCVAIPSIIVRRRWAQVIRKMSPQRVENELGRATEEKPDSLFYYLPEDGLEGGYFVSATFAVRKGGLEGVDVGFGHGSREPGIEE